MKQPLVECPKCKGKNCIEEFDEVDIGVGILKHVYGWECQTCGHIGRCEDCGTPDCFKCPDGCPSKLKD